MGVFGTLRSGGEETGKQASKHVVLHRTGRCGIGWLRHGSMQLSHGLEWRYFDGMVTVMNEVISEASYGRWVERMRY